MVLTADQQQVKALLTETITLLCKNGLHFQSEFSIEGLIGITLDQNDVFLVSIKETIKCNNSAVVEANVTQNKSKSSPGMLSRGKRFIRTTSNESPTVDTNSLCQSSVQATGSIEDSDSATGSNLLDVKLESATSDPSNHDQTVFQESTRDRDEFVNEISDPDLKDISTNISDSNVSVLEDITDSKFSDRVEPLPKRLRTVADSMSNVLHVTDGVPSDLQANNATVVGKVCKDEPLDIVEIPDDEMDSSLNSDNSYLMYMSMYGSGPDGGVADASGFSNQYNMSQISQNSMPGCSSWNTSPRIGSIYNHQDKNKKAAGRRTTLGDCTWKKCRMGKSYQCRECGKALSSLNSLKLHRQSIHNGLFQLTCPVCGKGLWRESDLRGHLANRHNMQKEFRCDVCGREFGYKSSLKDHLVRIHGISMFKNKIPK